jgi:hypothetical protein
MKRLLMLVMALAGLWLGACQKDNDSEEKNDPLGCYFNDKYANFSEESFATIGYPGSLNT